MTDIKWGEPAPIQNDETYIQDLVIIDIQSRKQHGIEKYGTALQPHNGRNATQDLYEELVDAVMYTKQMLVEAMNAQSYEGLWDVVAEWSNRTFGDEAIRDSIGPLNHLAREAREAAANPTDISEYADCQILVFDAARRAGISAEELLAAAYAKMCVNQTRKMGKPDAEGVIEHIREVGG